MSASAPREELPILLDRIEQREQTARRRAVVYSLLPVALTVVLLGYTARRVRDAQQEVQSMQATVDVYQDQVSQLETRLTEVQEELAKTQKKLEAATDLGQFVHQVDFVDAKQLASRFPGSERLLGRILELRERGVRWRLGGQSPSQGFDSPSFAMYILQELNASRIERRPDESLLEASRRLYDSLPPTTEPETGDLVFYPAGYALFYFVDPSEGPFVIGMTPFGITALKQDFAEPVGYRHVQWG